MYNELEGDTDGEIFQAVQINRRQKAKLRKKFLFRIILQKQIIYVLNSCDLKMLYLCQIPWHTWDKGR